MFCGRTNMTTRLLLIDPDISYIVTLKGALESTDEFRVSLAANAQAAEEALRHASYDAVIVNLDLDETDVAEMIQVIRQIRPRVPVIVTPSSESQYDRVRFLDVQGAISKPVTARELIPYVRETIEHARGPVTTPPQGDAPDEYSPPQLPPAIKQLLESQQTAEEAAESGPASIMFNQAERDDILGNLEVLDSDAESAAAPTPQDVLAEFEAFERVQTGQLDEILEDNGEWETITPHGEAPESESLPSAAPEDSEAPPFDAEFLDLPQELPEEYDEELLLDQDREPDADATILEWETDPTPASLHMPEQALPPAGTSSLPQEEEPPDTRTLEQPPEPASTIQLAIDDETSDTAVLPDQAEAEETRTLRNTDPLDKLIEAHGWNVRAEQTAAADRLAEDEPSRHPDDTPTVSSHDLEGIREFLATSESDQDAVDFGEVLDVVAQSSPEDYMPGPDDRDFHDLVDSLRSPEAAGVRRHRLEELLESIAADTSADEMPDASDNALDYVLDAIRRGMSPLPPGEAMQPGDEALEDDDTTIGEVIDGLFDPSFEGVLAALAGQEIDDTYEEPTYQGAPATAESAVPSPEDRIAPEEMSAEADAPDWLAGFDAESYAPPSEPTPPAPTEEPPITEEDSRSYPATAALEAVTGGTDDDDFSLTQLLHEIEEQLPPVFGHKPRLKPLPSWDDSAGLDEAEELETIFDRMEGRAQPERPADTPPIGADELSPLPELEDILPEPLTEPPLSPQDTRPAQALSPGERTDDDEHPIPTTDQPAEPAGGVDLDRIFELSGDDIEDAETLPDELRDLVAELPAADTGPALDAAGDPIAEAFYSGVRETGELDVLVDEEAWIDAEPEPAETPAAPEFEFPEEPESAPEYPQEDEREDFPEPAAEPEPEFVEEAPAEPAYDLGEYEPDEATDAQAPPPDDDHLIPVPVTEAARMLAGEEPADDESDIAQIAVTLTQYSLESSAQATLLSRSNKLLASAGNMPDEAIDQVFEIVKQGWRTSPAASDALIRFVVLPEVGEILLYSTLIEQDLTLSMVFSRNTRVRTVRQQARRLSESLNLVPEERDIPFERAVERTQPSRPTDLHPPRGWREAPHATGVATQTAEETAPREDPGPTTGYTCLWVPYDPGLELRGDFADEIYHWIGDIAEAEQWHIHDLDVQPDYVMLSLEIPQKTRPDVAITRLMNETAQRTADYYPDVVNGTPLWANGYYFVAPPRELSDREIARFITFQQQS